MIIHIDMDAFFASVEQLDNPGLRGKPVIVGRPSGRGVVTTASYEARKFGVHSAMPMFEAERNCPKGIIVPGRMTRYREISEKVMSILKDFSPLVEKVSIDEAYLDIAGCEKILGCPEEIGKKIRQKINNELDLSCSVGIAPVKFVAKIASDMKKPGGLTIIEYDEMPAFLKNLQVQKLPGVGKSMVSRLETFGIKTLGDVKKFPEKILTKKFGKYGKRLAGLARGIDNSPVIPFKRSKSISVENTFDMDIQDKETLRRHILRHSEKIGKQLRKHELSARTIALKIKTADFKLYTRRTTLKEPTTSSKVVCKEAVKLFNNFKTKRKIRLIGVGVSGFLPASSPVQMELFDDKRQRMENWEKIDKAMDTIAKKFGKDMIKKASVKN